MDLTTARDAVSVIFGSLSILSLVLTWILSRSRASAAEIGKLRDHVDLGVSSLKSRIETAEARITKIESDFRHMPDGTTVQSMQVSMTQLHGEIAVLTERLKPIGAISERLQEFLLDQANKR